MLKQKIVVIVGKKHKFFERNTISIREINGMNFINRDEGSETRRIFEECLSTNNIKVKSIMEVERFSMIQAVSENMGIGIISEPEFFNYKDIKKIYISDVDIFTQAHIVCLKSKKQNNLIKAFLETTKKHTH